MFDIIPLENQAPSVVYEWVVPLQHIAEQHLQTMTLKELNSDWKLNDFFETIFVINLPHAEERRKKITEELRSIGTKSFELFPAVDGRDLDPSIWKKFYLNPHHFDLSTEAGLIALDRLHQGQAGCYMSHYQIIQRVKDSFEKAKKEFFNANNDDVIACAQEKMRRFSRVLIIEDDSGFGLLKKNGTVTKKNGGYLLRQALQEMPNDWDLLYFVVQPMEHTIFTSLHLYKLNRSWSLNGYAINYSMYGPLIEHLKKIESPDVTQMIPIDFEISTLHKNYNVYAIYPSLVFSHRGQSYITGKTWKVWQGQPIYHK